MVGVTDLKDMSLNKLREIVIDREDWRAVHGVTESDATEQPERTHTQQLNNKKQLQGKGGDSGAMSRAVNIEIPMAITRGLSSRKSLTDRT